MQTTTESTARAGTPERTCVGCGKRNPADSLVRVVLAEPVLGSEPKAPATVVPDAKGGSFGRGAHVHAAASCLEQASRKGFPRAFKRDVRVEPSALAAQIADAFDRRIEGLLSGGVRGGHVVYGTDKVVEALRDGSARLVLLAADAAAAAERNEMRAATGEGRALVWAGDRMRLAAALGRRGDAARQGVAVCAVTSDRLAAEIRRAWLVAGGSRGAVGIDSGAKRTSRENAE